MKKILCFYFNLHQKVLISRPMQYRAASTHHLWCSRRGRSIKISQFLTISHPKCQTVSAVSSHCFKLFVSPSRPSQYPSKANILMIEGMNSGVTVVRADCLQEGEIV